LVDDDYLRFDFQADRLLTQEEIGRVEKRINQLIYLADDVVVEEMSLKDATKLGAKAFFEDKYGDTVRVVRVINKKLPAEFLHDDNEEHFSSFGEFVSQELC
jgi:alanyl-tRNA synthetase